MIKRSSSDGCLLRAAFKLLVFSLVVFALLPAKRLITVEIERGDDHTRLAHDQIDSCAIILRIAGLEFSSVAGYLTPDFTIRIARTPTIASHWYRGPPILS